MEAMGHFLEVFQSMYYTVQQKYSDLLWMGDPRTQHMFGVRTPFVTLAFVGTYLLLVTKIGPRMMKNREPFQLRGILIVYNFLITIVNLYIFLMMGFYGWFSRYNWICEPVNFSATYEEMQMVNVSHLYFITKFIEMLDTIFFVLRKKGRQLSILHMYHHSIMPVNVYLGMKFISTGHVTFFGMLNSLIHVPMYLYYGLAACGQRYQKYLWWKKYLTMIQIVQFTIIGIHSAMGLLHGCRVNRPLLYTLVSNTVVFMAFFSNFYVKNYLSKVRIIGSPKIPHSNGAIQNGQEKPQQNGVTPKQNGCTNGHILRPRITKGSFS